MRYKLKAYSIWEFGKRKDSDGNPHQEDSIFPTADNLKDTDRTFILCDGLGGHDAGEVASATVCEAMAKSIMSNGHDGEGVFTDEDLKKAISDAFCALDEKDNGAEKKMGTTMTFLKLHNDGATIAHMGDSRVYHIRPGKDGEDTRILFVTDDHSLVNKLVAIGEMTREEARHSKQKNVITRAMQPNLDVKPKADIYHTSDIKAGDFFYMCSDGMLEQDEMDCGESIRNIFSNAVQSVEDKVKILTRVTENNKDNHTALIIHIEDVDGVVQGEEKDSEVIPSIDFGLVEGDVSPESKSEETKSEDSKSGEENASSSEVKADVKNAVSAEDSHTEPEKSPNGEKGDTDAETKKSEKSEKESSSKAVVKTKKEKKANSKESARSMRGSNISEYIVRLTIVAIIVAIIVGICLLLN